MLLTPSGEGESKGVDPWPVPAVKRRVNKTTGMELPVCSIHKIGFLYYNCDSKSKMVVGCDFLQIYNLMKQKRKT